jgi:hypothetical protein
MSHSKEIIVRSATAADKQALSRLAALDSAGPLSGSAIVAEADARIVAALPLGAGRPIADPFERSGEAVALLQLRAEQLSRSRVVQPRLRDRVRGLLRAPLPG